MKENEREDRKQEKKILMATTCNAINPSKSSCNYRYVS